MTLLRNVLLVFCLLPPGFATTVFAGEPLNGDLIERWISSQDEVTTWGEKHSERIESAVSENFPTSAAEMLAPVKAAGLYSELEEILSKYGFSDPEKWADASVRIIGAMGVIGVGDSMLGVDVQEQIKQIENAEGMSPAQKQQMIEMMQQSVSAMKQMSTASEADIAAVKPYVDRLGEALE